MLSILNRNELISSRLSDLLGQLENFPAPEQPEPDCHKRKADSEDVYNVPGLLEEVPHSHLLEDAKTVDDVVEGGEDEEYLTGEGDVTLEVPLPGQTEYVYPVVGENPATNKLGHDLDHTKEIDLGVVEGELRDEGPRPVVYPILLLQGLESQLEFVNVTPESELVSPAAVLGEVSIESARLSLLLSHVLELSHAGAVLVQQRLPA